MIEDDRLLCFLKHSKKTQRSVTIMRDVLACREQLALGFCATADVTDVHVARLMTPRALQSRYLPVPPQQLHERILTSSPGDQGGWSNRATCRLESSDVRRPPPGDVNCT